MESSYINKVIWSNSIKINIGDIATVNFLGNTLTVWHRQVVQCAGAQLAAAQERTAAKFQCGSQSKCEAHPSPLCTNLVCQGKEVTCHCCAAQSQVFYITTYSGHHNVFLHAFHNSSFYEIIFHKLTTFICIIKSIDLFDLIFFLSKTYLCKWFYAHISMLIWFS